MEYRNNNINVAVLGASFDTGNLGVSALAASTIFLIKQQWPEAQVCILGGREYKINKIEISGTSTTVEFYPVRYCANIATPNHIWKLMMGVAFPRIMNYPFSKVRGQSSITNKQSTLDAILNADLICDITGGDSFSDIYGMGRFVKGFLFKRICQMIGKSFIMLPQTYGPFKSPLTEWMARQVLKKASKVYSRDKEGLKVIEGLIGKSEKVTLCPDVAFILEPRTPVSSHQLSFIRKQKMEADDFRLKTENSQLIGLNVSGLLYNGGYTGKNEFGLKGEYRKLMREIIDYFVTLDNTTILLIPHVVPEKWETENDLLACRKLWESLPEGLRKLVIVVQPEQGQPFFDQCEIKYLIGQCTFFLGSRMHATIAAISQCIPTVGLAYSKKFAGVYETAGVEDCVADLRSLTNKEVMNIIKTNYSSKVDIKKRLGKMIPGVQKQVMSIFEEERRYDN